MPSQPAVQEYHSYLIRLRRVRERPFTWQITLQDVRTGEKHHFTDLERLFAFVDQKLTADDLEAPEK